jgi:hypothetical protein
VHRDQSSSDVIRNTPHERRDVGRLGPIGRVPRRGWMGFVIVVARRSGFPLSLAACFISFAKAASPNRPSFSLSHPPQPRLHRASNIRALHRWSDPPRSSPTSPDRPSPWNYWLVISLQLVLARGGEGRDFRVARSASPWGGVGARSLGDRPCVDSGTHDVAVTRGR